MASYDAAGTCAIVLLADTFISEGMLHDVLVAAGAIDFSIDTPPKEDPRQWLTDKMTSIWASVANSNLNYFCAGTQPAVSHSASRIAAESFVIDNGSSLTCTDDSIASTLRCVAVDGILRRSTVENYTGYPPECQANAYHLWVQDIWDINCPIDVF
jgi:hypothetical protein